MNENNIINEDQISQLYGDIVDQPVEVAGIGDYFDCTGWNIFSRARECWSRW